MTPPLGVSGWSRNAETGAGPIRGGRTIDSTQYVLEYCVGRCARVDLSCLQWCVCGVVPAGELDGRGFGEDVSRARVEHGHGAMGKSGSGAPAWRVILAFGTPR
jgi:hypothetical protein